MIDWIQLSNVQILTSQGIIALAETAHWIKVCRPLVERHPTLISRRPPTQQRPPTPPHCHPPMFPAPKTATAKELYNSTLRQQVARYRRDRERWPRRGKTVRLENPGFPCNNSDPYRSLYQCYQTTNTGFAMYNNNLKQNWPSNISIFSQLNIVGMPSTRINLWPSVISHESCCNILLIIYA